MGPMSDEATERDPVLPTGKAEVASGEVGSGGAEVVSGDVPARAANDPLPAGPSAAIDRDADGLELGVAERPHRSAARAHRPSLVSDAPHDLGAARLSQLHPPQRGGCPLL
jgi:hypothetical protein